MTDKKKNKKKSSQKPRKKKDADQTPDLFSHSQKTHPPAPAAPPPAAPPAPVHHKPAAHPQPHRKPFRFSFSRHWPWLAVPALLLAGAALWNRMPEKAPAEILLSPVKSEFFHDQLVEYTLSVKSSGLAKKLEAAPLSMRVERGGKPVTTVGGLTHVPLKHDPSRGIWTAKWPQPWNAPDGTYHVAVSSGWPADAPAVKAAPFKIISRSFDPVPAGFGVLTLEDMNALTNIPAPDGSRKNALALVEWAQFIGADAVVIQGGESGGYDRKLPKDNPWYTRNDEVIRYLGEECHKRGMKFGVYVLSFLIGGPAKFSPDYEYGWEYREGKMVHGPDMKTRRGISIMDPRRPGDIVKMLSHWRDMPEVDFVGLDYIRPVFGGFELVDDFVRDMPVDPPAQWAKMDKIERMMWLGQKRRLRPTLFMKELDNFSFIDRWFWYRAHRSAQVVRAIKEGLGNKKPLWAFTLSWEKGWQHGQDPVMYRDAGVDMDAIMLYEADTRQFGGFVRQWNEYATQKELNLVVGDVIDWPLHQNTLNPAGPEDFYKRNMKAVREFHRDGPVRGLFIHDFNRARRGRVGPYGMREWLLAGGASLTTLRSMHGKLAYKLDFKTPQTMAPGEKKTVTVSFQEGSAKANVSVTFYSAPDLDVYPQTIDLSPDHPSADVTVRYAPTEASAKRAYRSFMAARASTSRDSQRCQIHMAYMEGVGTEGNPLPAPVQTPATPVEQPEEPGEVIPPTPPVPPAEPAPAEEVPADSSLK